MPDDANIKKGNIKWVPFQIYYVYSHDPNLIHKGSTTIPMPGMWAVYHRGGHSAVIGLDKNGNLIHIMVTNPASYTSPQENIKGWTEQRIVDVKWENKDFPDLFIDYPFNCDSQLDKTK